MRKTVTATVMFTDVAGSFKLRHRRGELTAQSMIATQQAMIRSQVQHHGGREVKTMGDGFMVAFGSARDAVHCAIAIERSLTKRSARGAEEVPKVRVGINIGEVMEEDG